MLIMATFKLSPNCFIPPGLSFPGGKRKCVDHVFVLTIERYAPGIGSINVRTGIMVSVWGRRE